MSEAVHGGRAELVFQQRQAVLEHAFPDAVAQLEVLKAVCAAHVPSKIDGTCAAVRRV